MSYVHAPEDTTTYTIPDLLRRRAELHGDRPALNIDNGALLTYGEWHSRSNRVAHGLLSAGLTRGRVVGLIFEGLDWIDYTIAYLGVVKAGGVATHLNSAVGAREIVRRMTWTNAFAVIHGQDVIPPSELANTGTLRRFESADESDVDIQLTTADIADILFTSGTTGPAKASTSPHGNLTHGRGPEGFALFGDPDLLLTPMPLGTTASATTISFSVHTPSTLVICPPNAPERMAELIEKLRVTSIMMTPWLAIQLFRAVERTSYDFSSVETIANASTVLPPAHARRLLELMPNAKLNMSYAASEAVPASIGHTFDPATPLATGRPLRKTELRIAGPDGDEVPVGEIGEIWLRSPAPKRYYFDNPELNERVHADRWTRTGDLGRVDADGLLYFFDRHNTVIRACGKLISSIEVEAALFEHPAVQEAAVFRVAQGEGEEDDLIAAAVVLADPDVLGKLPAFLAERLAPEQIPGQITPVESMPRSANGKVLKHELRALLY